MEYLCMYCGELKNEMTPFNYVTIARKRGEEDIKVCCNCSVKLMSHPKYVIQENNKILVPEDEKIELYKISKYNWKPKDMRSKQIREEEKLMKAHGRAMKGVLDFDVQKYKVTAQKIKDLTAYKVKK